MRVRLGRLVVVATMALGTLTAATSAAHAAPGAGTFTRITTPSTTKVFRLSGDPAATTNHFVVSGEASPDVTSVDIACTFRSNAGDVISQVFASDVPVSGGAFSTVATYPNFTSNCRLRALPQGEPTTGYLGSYSGPLLYTYVLYPGADSNHIVYGLIGADEVGDGIAELRDAGGCGVTVIATVALPDMQVRGNAKPGCLLQLPPGNLPASGPSTASSIRVGGHNAYLPSVVHNYLIGHQALTVTQPKLTITTSHAADGSLTITESAPLMRCSQADTYPPTATSCPSLVPTGVKFVRVSTIRRGAHEVRVRDSFVSSDAAAHAVAVQYQNDRPPPDTGRTGYVFPGHPGSFQAATSSQSVTGLGTKAGTVLIRSDLYSTEGDQQASTYGVSYSRAPSKITFNHTVAPDRPTIFALPYSFTVPKNGTAQIGFAVTEQPATSAVRAMAAAAVGEMINAPSITSPANRKTLKGHKIRVTGSVTAGANGLPTSVSVNGHAAHLSPAGAKKNYSVSFRLPFGKHTITVTARDLAGNTKAAAIRIRNKK